MNPERAERAFIRVLAGVAWADGEVTSAEREKILRIAAEIGLSSGEIDAMIDDLDRPAGLESTLARAKELLDSLPRDRRAELFGHLVRLVEADGRIDPAEKKIIDALQDAGGADPPLLVSRLRGLFARKGAASASPAPVGAVRSLLDAIRPKTSAGGIDGERHVRAVLFGSILRRVAFADGRVDPSEIEQIRAMLSGTYGFDAEQTASILAAIESQAADAFDRQRLCASFNRHSTMEERVQLLGCLFAVAKADSAIGDDELRELRLIANYLWIDAREFHQIRAGRG